MRLLLEILPPFHERNPGKSKIAIVIVPDEKKPQILCAFDLLLVNNRTDRPERVLGGVLALKKRHWRLWKKTLAFADLQERTWEDMKPHMWSSFLVEAISDRKVVSLWGQIEIQVPVASLPSYMELVLELRMVGPMRQIRRVVDNRSHSWGM